MFLQVKLSTDFSGFRDVQTRFSSPLRGEKTRVSPVFSVESNADEQAYIDCAVAEFSNSDFYRLFFESSSEVIPESVYYHDMGDVSQSLAARIEQAFIALLQRNKLVDYVDSSESLHVLSCSGLFSGSSKNTLDSLETDELPRMVSEMVIDGGYAADASRPQSSVCSSMFSKPGSGRSTPASVRETSDLLTPRL
jgi:hypothetical protein